MGGATKIYVYHTLGEPPFTKKPNKVSGYALLGMPHKRGCTGGAQNLITSPNRLKA